MWDLNDLFEGKIAVLRILNYYSTEDSQHAVDKLSQHKIVYYHNADGVGKIKNIGMAYFEVEAEEQEETHYKQKYPSFERTREAFSPFKSPIELVMGDLNKEWPPGADFLNLGRGPMYAGLIRSLKTDILPHEDKIERDDPTGALCLTPCNQIALNCYLSIPKVGGALQIWDISLQDAKHNELKGDSYGIHRSKLPPRTLTIEPKQGELIAFQCRFLHAVTGSDGYGVTDGNRVSISSFLLYQGLQKPISIWS